MKIKVGDILFNGWASENNPIKKTIVISISNSKIKCVYVDNSKFKTVEYYKNDLMVNEDDKYKIIGHVDLVKFINDEISNHV